MKIAFALIPEKGHINPYIGPAQALAELGHDVPVAAPGDIDAQIALAGLEFRRDLLGPDGDGRITRGPELVALIQDASRLDHWIEQLLLGGIEEQVTSISRWLQRDHPDAIVVDPLYYAAVIAAYCAGIPWASVSNSLNPVIPPDLDSALLATTRRLGPLRDKIFRGYGIDGAKFSGCDALSPHLNIAFTTEAFTGPPPAGVHLVGPSFPLHGRGDEVALRPLPEDRPIVYASFGSQIYHWPAIFEKLLSAGSMLGVHLVFSLGDLIDDARWAQPVPHCDVYRYAPQLPVLKRASAFVTHGGANSVMEAIAAGVPMLISPMCNDQFHQAYFIRKSGVGCVENLIDAPVERIAEQLRSLLESTATRAAMRTVQHSYRTDGARTAAALIAGLR